MRLRPFAATSLLSLVLLPAAALFVATGCGNTAAPPPPSRPQYALVCAKGVSFDPDKPAGYDTRIGGFWLCGAAGTVRLDPISPPPATAEAPTSLFLSIRTQNIALLRIGTPECIFSFAPANPAFIDVRFPADPSHVQAIRNTDSINITRADGRFLVKLSAEFLRLHAPHGASLSWFGQQ
ncbi:MAG: hypothetical protein LBS59_00070 [Puniceicoccales bacterium]|jgi:hypothetical protein|nr:hypothetical protein [Puniceicoccales bacterium]